jgi:hypothetical protein
VLVARPLRGDLRTVVLAVLRAQRRGRALPRGAAAAGDREDRGDDRDPTAPGMGGPGPMPLATIEADERGAGQRVR